MTDTGSGRPKATVQIPLALMDAGMKIGAHFAPEVEGVNMDQLMEALRSGVTGKIIDVTETSYVVELTGTSHKLDAFIQAVPEGLIVEVVRSGPTGIARGDKGLTL
mgnify:CR=1 FL=1